MYHVLVAELREKRAKYQTGYNVRVLQVERSSRISWPDRKPGEMLTPDWSNVFSESGSRQVEIFFENGDHNPKTICDFTLSVSQAGNTKTPDNINKHLKSVGETREVSPANIVLR